MTEAHLESQMKSQSLAAPRLRAPQQPLPLQQPPHRAEERSISLDNKLLLASAGYFTGGPASGGAPPQSGGDPPATTAGSRSRARFHRLDTIPDGDPEPELGGANVSVGFSKEDLQQHSCSPALPPAAAASALLSAAPCESAEEPQSELQQQPLIGPGSSHHLRGLEYLRADSDPGAGSGGRSGSGGGEASSTWGSPPSQRSSRLGGAGRGGARAWGRSVSSSDMLEDASRRRAAACAEVLPSGSLLLTRDASGRRIHPRVARGRRRSMGGPPDGRSSGAADGGSDSGSPSVPKLDASWRTRSAGLEHAASGNEDADADLETPGEPVGSPSAPQVGPSLSSPCGIARRLFGCHGSQAAREDSRRQLAGADHIRCAVQAAPGVAQLADSVAEEARGQPRRSLSLRDLPILDISTAEEVGGLVLGCALADCRTATAGRHGFEDEGGAVGPGEKLLCSCGKCGRLPATCTARPPAVGAPGADVHGESVEGSSSAQSPPLCGAGACDPPPSNALATGGDAATEPAAAAEGRRAKSLEDVWLSVQCKVVADAAKEALGPLAAQSLPAAVGGTGAHSCGPESKSAGRGGSGRTRSIGAHRDMYRRPSTGVVCPV